MFSMIKNTDVWTIFFIVTFCFINLLMKIYQNNHEFYYSASKLLLLFELRVYTIYVFFRIITKWKRSLYVLFYFFFFCKKKERNCKYKCFTTFLCRIYTPNRCLELLRIRTVFFSYFSCNIMFLFFVFFNFSQIIH